LSQKTLFLGQKVWKKFGKVWKFRKLGFPNVWKFQKFQKLLFSELSEIYEKMTLNRLETSVKSLECRALQKIDLLFMYKLNLIFILL